MEEESLSFPFSYNISILQIVNLSLETYMTKVKENDKTPLIRIQWLDWKYPKAPKNTLNDVNFELTKGSFCFVVWKSGVGKTTLTKFLLRQLKPPKGTMFHHRDDIARYSAREVQKYRRKIWVVFQDCKLLDWKTVRENILYPLEIDWASKKVQEEKLQTILSMLHLTDKEHVLPALLSWWEKQRVAIARALIRNPEFLVADEPTGNIDHEASRMIADTCIDINKQWTTILFITHDLSLIDYVKQKHDVTVVEIS